MGVADPDLDLLGETSTFDVVAGDSGVMLVYLEGDQGSVVGKGTGTDAYEPLRVNLPRTPVNRPLLEAPETRTSPSGRYDLDAFADTRRTPLGPCQP